MNILRFPSSLRARLLTAGSAALTLLGLCTGCRREVRLPDTYTPTEQEAVVYPDYTDIIIPPNIAPLNFIVRDAAANAFVAELKGREGSLLTAARADGKMCIDSAAWHDLLRRHTGADLELTVYARHANGWVKHPSSRLTVAEEPIDPYLSYRLIEPGYELYRQLGLYQRNLTNFDEEAIYENNRTYEQDHNHCVNCHNYQAYDTGRMLFHVRGNHGGTVVVHDGRAEKVALKHDSILTSGVYPSWHPTLPLVAFSTNRTGQAFHLKHTERIEVIDHASDLFLYDADRHTVRMIRHSRTELETFPCWNPTGDTLYYCTATVPALAEMPDSMYVAYLLPRYDSLRYDIRCLPFDARRRTFGAPVTVVACSEHEQSASVPRISPDGRYLLYTQGDYGQFHIWHKSSDLWVKRLGDDSPAYPLTATNSNDVDSYHTWSSNGRWIVFSSRRDDGNYTRPYIAYFDKQGQGHKAFLLPQADPEHNLLLLKSYNVPELTRHAVTVEPNAFRQVIYNTEAVPVRYDDGK